MGVMSEMDIEVKNLCPGKPERPIKGSEWTFDNLRGEWFEELKLDGDRVVLSHGIAFNRHEALYQRDFSKKLGDIYDELRQLFTDCKVFDIEYMATGPMAGKCALLDIPDMVSNAHLPEYGNPCRHDTPYDTRHMVMRSTLPCHNGTESFLKYDIQVLPCLRVTDNKGELYHSAKRINEERDDYPFEGVVMKHPNHTYRFNRNKGYCDQGHWCKVRFK